MAVEITLPVAPISRKILLREYGGSPIKLTNHDLLFHQLSYTRVRVESNIQKMQSALTSSISFELSEKLAARINTHLHHVGYHLYQVHKMKMMEFIDAQVKASTEATTALKSFYKKYGFDDDDFDFETAYRYWKRYKTKKTTTIFLTKEASTVPRMSKKWKILLDHSQVENVAQQFQQIASHLISDLPSKLSQHMRYYLHYNYSNSTLRELQDILNAPSFQIIAYGNKAAKNAIDTDHRLNELLKYCIEQQINT